MTRSGGPGFGGSVDRTKGPHPPAGRTGHRRTRAWWLRSPTVHRNADPTEFFLPGSYACLILAVAERWGVTSADLFTPLGLDEQDLEAPGSRIPVSTACAVIGRARLLTGEPALGIHIGLQTHPVT